MKMIKLIQVFLTVWITLSVLTAFSQEGVVSPACWLRTDSIRMGDEVWRDVSTHGLHATPRSGLIIILPKIRTASETEKFVLLYS